MPSSASLTLAVACTVVLMETEKAGGQTQSFYSLDPQQGAYNFGYDTGSLQHQSFREETRSEDGGVHGSYGYVESGVLRVTEYTADRLGYRCRQTVRYLVHPNRGVFVPVPAAAPPSWASEANLVQSIDGLDRGPNPAELGAPSQAAQPARVLGKKVQGRYKDVTSKPAVGGTAAVRAWDSAHTTELRDDEVFRTRPSLGGALVWPVTEDGRRVVWQPFRR